MSTAEMLIEKGKQEGRQEGWKEKERIVASGINEKLRYRNHEPLFIEGHVYNTGAVVFEFGTN